MNTQAEEIVKLMERGQVTLPASIRRVLGLRAKSWLRVQLTEKKDIILTPLYNPKSGQLKELLVKLSKDKSIYWSKQDDKNLKQIRELSKKRLKKLYAGSF